MPEAVRSTPLRAAVPNGRFPSAAACKVVKGKRFVDSGKVVTTAEVTAGIDGALHVVERLLGKEAARWTAEEWMEHRRETVSAK